MPKTIKLFNGLANEIQDAELSHVNGEWVAVFEDGHFWKYPFTEDMAELRAAIETHNTVNKPVVTAAMIEERQAKADALLDSL